MFGAVAVAFPSAVLALRSNNEDVQTTVPEPQIDRSVLVAEIDSIRTEIKALREAIAPLDRFMGDGVNTLLACGADTALITEADPAMYRVALESYQSVKPMTRFYNPYKDIDLDSMERSLQGRLGNMEKIARAQALLVGKNTPALEEKSLKELSAVLKTPGLAPQDSLAVATLRSAIQKDRNWGGLFKKTIDKLATRPSLPDEEAANEAFEEAVKGIILAKLAEVYGEGCERLPENLVKLNDILFQLIDATRDYSFSQYRDTVSSDSTYKEWLKSLKERL